MNWFGPRFSLRTLAIIVTLVGAYFGAWEATKKWGVPQIPKKQSEPSLLINAGSNMPLIVWKYESDQGLIDFGEFGGRAIYVNPRYRYYLWLFGPEFQLPFESSEQDDFELDGQQPSAGSESSSYSLMN